MHIMLFSTCLPKGLVSFHTSSGELDPIFSSYLTPLTPPLHDHAL